jgi:xanthine dehydrogenase accessory factor
MRELLADLRRWRAQGKTIAVARVVDLEGSGPRDPGAAMAVSAAGEVLGSVSGGCVEGAVVTAGLEAIETGAAGMHTFGYSDDDAFAVGLTCGGTIHLFVQQADDELLDHLAAVEAAVRRNEPVALATVVDGPGAGRSLRVEPDREPVGTLGDPDLDRVVARDAEGELAASGMPAVRRYGPHGEAMLDEVAVFVEPFVPPPRMLVFGAVDFTGALVKVARVLGYHTIVCDARPVFATKARFPLADEVLVDWPDRILDRVGPTLTPRDAVCILTHDPKFDVPAVVGALATDAGYLGVMGSRRTHDDRVARLREAGVDDGGLARLHSPIGLDLGARTPEETAVAICAEILAVRTGRTSARPLRETEGPIHR